LNGDGVIDLTTADATALNADGSRVETITETNADGSLRDRTTSTTGPNGLSTSVATDRDGNNVFERVATGTVAFNANGSRTTAVTTRSANGTVVGQTVTTTSADGLERTVQRDLDGDGSFDRLQTDVTVLNVDGGTTRTVTERNSDGSLHDQ